MPELDYLLTSIRDGRAALFLGSGALVGASLGDGRRIPLGNDLRDLLSDRFLNSKFKTESLQRVSELAISQHSLGSVQDFIRDYFSDIEPADFHRKISRFMWKAIFTTNFDMLVERVYNVSPSRLQSLSKHISNSDDFIENSSTNGVLPYIKLHGCVSRTNDATLPLILTVDQYNDSLQGNRTNLFNYLYEISLSSPIVFIGQSLNDSNVRAILQELQRNAPLGQRHYLLKPNLEIEEREFWGSKKVSAIDCTLEQLISELEDKIPEAHRTLAITLPIRDLPIETRFTNTSKASDVLRRFLEESCEFIFTGSTYEVHSPELFYKGAELGWYPVAEGLNVRRAVESVVESEILAKPESQRAEKAELIVIKGEAGSGKSVLLRSLAWNNVAKQFGILLWFKNVSSVDVAAIAEICEKTQERVFLFWDNAAASSLEIISLFTAARKSSLPLTIITSERNNVWNTRCGDLDTLATQVYEIRYLSEREIEDLIKKLELHNCLGEYLSTKSHAERVYEFREMYGRQILVALYEATKGQDFEEIICNEYDTIPGLASKNLYRTICTLNRLRVPVRAGLISRIHDITFEQFKEKFFFPLEKIVLVETSQGNDTHYKARHPEIAEIVFKRTLSNNLDRFNEYLRILSKINTSFESDRTSFRSLVRATTLKELFASHDDIVKIYEVATLNVGEDPYLLQQIANYERIRDNGNLSRALKLLSLAIEISPHDRSLLHSQALTWLEVANQAGDPAKKHRARSEALGVLENYTKRWGDSSHMAGVRIRLLVDDLKDILNIEGADLSISEAIRKIEALFIETHRKFPLDSHLISLESEFARLLSDNPRAIVLLEKAFSINEADPYLASRLTRVLEKTGANEKAGEVLKKALDKRPADQALNFQYAEHLRRFPSADFENITYYYKRAYTQGDKNYEAQFWHARYLYDSRILEQKRAGLALFDKIRKSPLPFDQRVAIKDYLKTTNDSLVFHGELVGKRDTYGFIRVDGSGDDIFCPSSEVADDLWEAIALSDRVKFKVAFTYSGPICSEVYPE